MEICKVKMDVKSGETVKLVFIGDTHIQNANCDKRALAAAIKRITETCKQYKTILVTMGDLNDFIVNSNDPRFNPAEIDREMRLHDLKDIANYECERVIEMFQPATEAAFKTISIVGNHEEAYIKRNGFDVYKRYATALGAFRLGALGCIALHMDFGCRRLRYRIAAAHGAGRGSNEPGAVIRRCKEVFSRFPFDLCVMGHFHKMEDSKDSINDLNQQSTDIIERERYFATTGCFLKKYVAGNRGYGEDFGGKNPDIGYIEVSITNKYKQMANSMHDKIETRIEKVYL